MYYKTFFLLALLGLAMAGCKKDEDTAKPVIETFKVNDQTAEAEVTAGNELHVDVTFADNEDLKEYKIDIHDGFDGHGHGKRSTNFTKWSYQEVKSCSGKSFTDHFHFNVPTDAMAGPYHFILRVIDAAGNEGDFGEVDLLIKNSGQAVVNVTSTQPAANPSGEIELARGATLALQGTVTDADGLIDEIEVTLAEAEAHQHNKASEQPIYEYDSGPVNAASWDFSAMGAITIPANAELGAYDLTVTAWDADGNITIAIAMWDVHIE